MHSQILAQFHVSFSIRIGRCNAGKYMRQLLPIILKNEIPLREIITHILPLNDGVAAYDIFANRRDNAIKVLLKP